MEFGSRLRRMRRSAGLGIKQLGPELGVTYTYLSKVESNRAKPSEQFVERVSAYFETDTDELMLAAGHVPPDILEILRENPEDAVEFLRERFRRKDEKRRGP